jgi:hypothetical protein
MPDFRLTAAIGLAISAVGGLALAAEPARAGLYFEQQVTTAVGAQPAGPLISARVWWQGPRMRLERRSAGERGGTTVLIVRLDQERAFRLDPARRVAQEIDLAAERARSQLELSVVGDRLGVGARVARIRRTRQIAGYVCQGYRLSTDAGAIDVWLSQAVPADMGAFAEFLKWLGAEDALGPFLDALRRLPGFPLSMRSRLEVSGRLVETRATVTRVRAAAAPESLFELPPEYRVEPTPASER